MRRHHYPRHDRGGQERLLRANVAGAAVQQASNVKASVGAVNALEDAVDGDLTALSTTLSEVGLELEGALQRIEILENQ